MSQTKENKVWLVVPIIERDASGNITKFGYPEAVVTSRKKAKGIIASLNTAENLPADSDTKYTVTSQVLQGW